MFQLRRFRLAAAVWAAVLIPLVAMPGAAPSGAATRASVAAVAKTTVSVTSTVDTFVARRDSDDVFTGYGQYDIPLQEFVVNVGHTETPITVAAVPGAFRGFQKFDFSQVAGRRIVKAVWHGKALAVTGTEPVVVALSPIRTAWDPWQTSWDHQPAIRATQRYSRGFRHPGWQTADITPYVANYASGRWANQGLELRVPAGNGLVQLESYIDGPSSYVDVTYRNVNSTP